MLSIYDAVHVVNKLLMVYDRFDIDGHVCLVIQATCKVFWKHRWLARQGWSFNVMDKWFIYCGQLVSS